MMVFVLLTFGGWNEAVYVSAELRDSRRRMGWVMILSLLIVTVLYLLINLAYLRVLAIPGMAGSDSRSEEHTSELQSLMRIPYAVFCLNKKIKFPNTMSALRRFDS